MSINQLKLICLPYAGGSSSMFFKWKPLLAKSGTELIAPELAGRGKRLNEDMYHSIAEAAADMYVQLAPVISRGNYAIFGHSMGSLIAFELLQKIRENDMPLPLHIFFSGRGAPHVRDPRKIIYHQLEEKDFIKEIVKLGGTTRQVFDDPDLKAMFLPILRNDLRITETYRQDVLYKPFKTNISVFIGKSEDATHEQIEGWRSYAAKNFDIHYFDGGHFFLHDQYPEMVETINKLIGVSFYQLLT